MDMRRTSNELDYASLFLQEQACEIGAEEIPGNPRPNWLPGCFRLAPNS